MDGVGISETGEIVTYNAISYVWGQTALDSAIMCNGEWLPICKSLAEALFHLSKSASRAYFWADAVCINQEDPAERAMQVQNMLRIFEKAKSIVAWMGPLDLRHTPHLTLINHLTAGDQGVLNFLLDKLHLEQCIAARNDLLRVLLDFTHRSWFARTWIRQEVFAAKTIHFYFPHFRMAGNLREPMFWTKLISQLESVKVPVHGTPPYPYPKKLSEEFQIMCKHFQHNGTDRPDYIPPQERIRHSVYSLRTLQEGTTFTVSDPRDRVYALLGVLLSLTKRLYVETPFDEVLGQSQESSTTFPVDYNKSVAEVYGDVMKYLINVNRNLDCLCVLQDRRNQASDMPSWVLDWRDSRSRYFIENQPESSDLRATLGLPPKQDSNEASVLRIYGFTAFRIEQLTAGVFDIITRSRYYLFQQDTDPHYTKYPQHSYVQSICKNISGSCVFGVPRNSMIDDEIVFAKGARRALVLRHVSKDKYLFVGPASRMETELYIVELGLKFKDARLRVVYPDWKLKAKVMKTYQLV